MTKFGEHLVKVVGQIPPGKVVSYGQVAAYLGMPRAARVVGWTLRQLKQSDLPWWRVINSQGRISIKGNVYFNADDQRELLRKEGVEVGKDYSVDIDKYRFLASEQQVASWLLK